MKSKLIVSDLPVMKSCCKTCPFKLDDRDKQLDPILASQVTERTLFKAQQICHGTEGPKRQATHRCYGSYEFNKTIYKRLGLDHLLK